MSIESKLAAAATIAALAADVSPVLADNQVVQSGKFDIIYDSPCTPTIRETIPLEGNYTRVTNPTTGQEVLFTETLKGPQGSGVTANEVFHKSSDSQTIIEVNVTMGGVVSRERFAIGGGTTTLLSSVCLGPAQ